MQRVRNRQEKGDEVFDKRRDKSLAESQRGEILGHKKRMGKVFRIAMKKREQTTDMILNVLIAFLIPMAIAGIWFMTHIKWWI